MRMKKILTIIICIIILSSFSKTFAIEETEFDFFNLGFGENIGYLSVPTDTIPNEYEKYVNKSSVFSTLNIEWIKFTSTANLNYTVSIESDVNFGFKDNKYIASNLYSLKLNLGIISSYKVNLGYKNGERVLYFMFSGGVIADEYSKLFSEFSSEDPRYTFGIQIISRFIPAKTGVIFEPLYTKISFSVDKLGTDDYLYKGGLSLCFDVPELVKGWFWARKQKKE